MVLVEVETLRDQLFKQWIRQKVFEVHANSNYASQIYSGGHAVLNHYLALGAHAVVTHGYAKGTQPQIC